MFSRSEIDQLIHEILQFQLSWNNVNDVKKSTKVDSSPVTEIDHALSDFFKHHALSKAYQFYSEEDFGEFKFPALILDPLDGTRDFIAGRAECAVSAAWMESASLDGKNFAMILNPFSGFRLTSADHTAWQPRPQSAPYLGLVSRSEWDRGLYRTHHTQDFQLQPRGSIAFKLALLASGACDFVVSLRPKNVWDIAAGTLLLHQREMELWSNGKRVTELSQPSYEAPLIWAPAGMINPLLSQFSP